MPCTCAPDPALIEPLPFPPEIKSRILCFLLTTTTCNSHFIDLLCLEQAVYAVHAKELYREMTLDGENMAKLWRGCDSDCEFPADSSLLELLSNKRQAPLYIPIFYPPAFRKLLLARHCVSLYLPSRITGAEHLGPPVEEQLRSLRQDKMPKSPQPFFQGIENLIIGKEYMEHVSEVAASAERELQCPLELLYTYLPWQISTVCIHWPENGNARLGQELCMFSWAPQAFTCYKLIIHNAKLDVIPPMLGPLDLILDLSPEVYDEQVDDEYNKGDKQVECCLGWLSQLVDEVAEASQSYRNSLTVPQVRFTNLHTWKSSTIDSVACYNTSTDEKGKRDTCDDRAVAIIDSRDIQKGQRQELEDCIFKGPQYCPCCAAFKLQDDVDLWKQDEEGENKGQVYQRVPKEYFI
ncbi:hypothetical protein L198_05938 [Cryptococcus wingfieldii CBS 7118]|uniref:Uncharacterized protein n=1 Tax=Cryptococcus wingfieldii CBS 7118 TaxID=1295528 RepID=A0A1E3IS35_9TREE|nr:hypothetical protein L198_05938 [Cryptococcus wingfieldii CBS 7118]ODN91424.1 hypothetical protein L198_05938 [Cryptococcus wingfieldii CBS 7118]